MIHIIGMGDEISIGYGFEIGRGSCKSVFISANLEKNESFEQMIYFRMNSTSPRLN